MKLPTYTARFENNDRHEDPEKPEALNIEVADRGTYEIGEAAGYMSQQITELQREGKTDCQFAGGSHGVVRVVGNIESLGRLVEQLNLRPTNTRA